MAYWRIRPHVPTTRRCGHSWILCPLSPLDALATPSQPTHGILCLSSIVLWCFSLGGSSQLGRCTLCILLRYSWHGYCYPWGLDILEVSHIPHIPHISHTLRFPVCPSLTMLIYYIYSIYLLVLEERLTLNERDWRCWRDWTFFKLNLSKRRKRV